MIEDILEVPPEQRKYVVVVPPTGRLEKTLEALGWTVVPILQGGRVLYKMIRKIGLPRVLQLSQEAANALVFPRGIQLEILHRQHPCRPSQYIPAAEYNPHVLTGKICELARVMMAAGATAFDISATSSEAVSLVMDAGSSIGSETSGKFSSVRSGTASVNWSYRGSGRGDRTLPPDLVWYDHQPDWQAIWESAVHHGATYNRLVLAHDTTHELTAELAQKFQKAGFKIGGTFRDTASFRVEIEVHFG